MKKKILFGSSVGGAFVLAFLAMSLHGCAEKIDLAEPAGPTTGTRTYTVGFDGTRTTVAEGGAVSWEAGDVIKYYSKANGTVGTFTVSEPGPRAKVDFDVEDNASFLIAIYGGNDVFQNTSGKVFRLDHAISSKQSGKFREAHVAVAKTYDISENTLMFTNITSIVKFSFERTDVAYVTFKPNDATIINSGDYGEIEVTFSGTAPSASYDQTYPYETKVTVGGAGDFYMSALPCTLTDGFTIKWFDAKDNFLGKIRTDKSVELKRNTILNLGVLGETYIPEAPITYEPDLSSKGTANCYIVPMAGQYSFDATVKGSSTEPIDGDPYSVVVLWETFGTDQAISPGDIISDVTYSGGRISFNANGRDGNALIALRDRDEEILWTWHIWSCMGYDPDFYAQEYRNDAGTMMDRNLGATSLSHLDVRTYGLFYKWGRSRPLIGPATPNSSSQYAVCTDEKAYYYYEGTEDPYGWDVEKTKYDPCPAGYKVPTGGDDGIWKKAAASKYLLIEDNEQFGVDMTSFFGTSSPCWYPIAGRQRVDPYNWYPGSAGYQGYYWAATKLDRYADYAGSVYAKYPDSMTLYNHTVNSNSIHIPGVYDETEGFSVRCQKEIP